ncbi:hypothetical protein D3C85_1728410 [compost metagenome]
MPSKAAVVGSWARVTPAAALISFTPSVPSLPVPDSTMPMALPGRCCARDTNKASTGRCRAPVCDRAVSLIRLPTTVMTVSGGIT